MLLKNNTKFGWNSASTSKTNGDLRLSRDKFLESGPGVGAKKHSKYKFGSVGSQAKITDRGLWGGITITF